MSDTPTPNTPDLWLGAIPRPTDASHKYDRGHAAIYAAPKLTGATRLAAAACSRIGAGLVSVLAIELDYYYRNVLPPDIMVQRVLGDLRKTTAALIGPGGFHYRAMDDFSGDAAISCAVLDADAISHGCDIRKSGPSIIITPHEGELAKHFPDGRGTREEQAREIARRIDGVVVLKGARTLIASPDGSVIENSHASPWLAKAGTGDVLAGFITGLAAQGMPPALASAAAVWIHGDAAMRIGPGLVASDLEARVPEVLSGLGIR